MNAFLRQIAVLGVLSALGELVLPEGSVRPAVRLVLSLMCSVVLVVTVTGWLKGDSAAASAQAQQGWLTVSQHHQRETDELARRQAVESAANQLSQAAQRYCQNAGYEAQAVSYWTQQGALERLELRLAPDDMPLVDESTLLDRLCTQFGLERAQVTIR